MCVVADSLISTRWLASSGVFGWLAACAEQAGGVDIAVSIEAAVYHPEVVAV